MTSPLSRFHSRFYRHSLQTSKFQIFFPTLDVTVHREREDITSQQFVSELGGAAGLFLGVSLISVVKAIKINMNSIIYFKQYIELDFGSHIERDAQAVRTTDSRIQPPHSEDELEFEPNRFAVAHSAKGNKTCLRLSAENEII